MNTRVLPEAMSGSLRSLEVFVSSVVELPEDDEVVQEICAACKKERYHTPQRIQNALRLGKTDILLALGFKQVDLRHMNDMVSQNTEESPTFSDLAPSRSASVQSPDGRWTDAPSRSRWFRRAGQIAIGGAVVLLFIAFTLGSATSSFPFDPVVFCTVLSVWGALGIYLGSVILTLAPSIAFRLYFILSTVTLALFSLLFGASSINVYSQAYEKSEYSGDLAAGILAVFGVATLILGSVFFLLQGFRRLESSPWVCGWRLEFYIIAMVISLTLLALSVAYVILADFVRLPHSIPIMYFFSAVTLSEKQTGLVMQTAFYVFGPLLFFWSNKERLSIGALIYYGICCVLYLSGLACTGIWYWNLPEEYQDLVKHLDIAWLDMCILSFVSGYIYLVVASCSTPPEESSYLELDKVTSSDHL